MNTILNRPEELLIPVPEGFCELVRGTDQRLVTLLAPIVREKNVVLDMERVRRIDAAGIAALISVYGSARKAGNNFRICNLNSHVAEILGLVGLDRTLVQRADGQPHYAEHCLECHVA